jgi:cobalt-zinc-cadmium efflux system outer membrane protein
MRGHAIGLLCASLAFATVTVAHAETKLTYAKALSMARTSAPDLKVAEANVTVANAGVGVAGIFPNPTLFVGSTTQGAKFSAGVAIPLPILGQLGAGKNAAHAELGTVKVESEVVWGEVRTATAHAFVALWLAERTSGARADAAAIQAKLEGAVKGRVDVGSAPEIEMLRIHAERLRADADALEAALRVGAARAKLGRWIGIPGGADLATSGDPDVPAPPPSLATLAKRLGLSPTVRRETADAAAADARADKERALVRPMLSLELGMDLWDPTLPRTNYRALLGIELPLFSMRGPLIAREEFSASAARARASAENARLEAELTSAYRTFEAISARLKALDEGVVPAAEKAAVATEESYSLGHSALVAVLDAERARIDARLAVIEARAAGADAWIDIEHLVGIP